ncbi:MAG TPA: hypothetical protein VD902_02300, partial [Symbiobacteriaceae bacterium]|nr:hypothetical protein [Symbiobacteriaceae bacterium]
MPDSRVWLLARAGEETAAALPDLVGLVNTLDPQASVSILLEIPEASGSSGSTLAKAYATLRELQHLLTQKSWGEPTKSVLLRAVHLLQPTAAMPHNAGVISEQAIRLMSLEYIAPKVLHLAGLCTSVVLRVAQTTHADFLYSGATGGVANTLQRMMQSQPKTLPTDLYGAPSVQLDTRAVLGEWRRTWLIGDPSIWQGYQLPNDPERRLNQPWLQSPVRAAYLVAEAQIRDLSPALDPFRAEYDKRLAGDQLHAPVVAQWLGEQRAAQQVPPAPPAVPIAAGPATHAAPQHARRYSVEEERETALAAAYAVIFNLKEFPENYPDILFQAADTRRGFVQEGSQFMALLREKNRLQSAGAVAYHARKTWR